MNSFSDGVSSLPLTRLGEQGQTVTTTAEMTLIQCTNSKRDVAAPARELYDPSQYFRAMRSWATAREQVHGTPWAILSGKHGLVWPDTVVKPYDAVGISEAQATQIAEKLVSRNTTTVHVTAGRQYTDTLVPELERAGIDVVNHFAGDPIGVRMQKLQAEVDRLTHNTL